MANHVYKKGKKMKDAKFWLRTYESGAKALYFKTLEDMDNWKPEAKVISDAEAISYYQNRKASPIEITRVASWILEGMLRTSENLERKTA